METVGALLRMERERRGLTIKDIEQGTSIRALYLTAIEEDNYSIIPGEVYLKGFIRNYANFLGLNGQQIVELYHQSKPNYEPPKEEIQPQTKRSTQDKLINQRSSSNKWIAIAVVLLLGAGLGVYANMNSFNQPAPQNEAKKENPAPQSVTPAPVPQQAAAPVVVIAKFTDDCWTSVTADGKVIYEGTAKANEQLTWNAQKNLVIRAGNAGAIDVTFNNQPQGKLGNKGQIAEKTYSATPNQPKS